MEIKLCFVSRMSVRLHPRDLERKFKNEFEPLYKQRNVTAIQSALNILTQPIRKEMQDRLLLNIILKDDVEMLSIFFDSKNFQNTLASAISDSAWKCALWLIPRGNKSDIPRGYQIRDDVKYPFMTLNELYDTSDTKKNQLRYQVIEQLLKSGAQVNTYDKETYMTPLMKAIWFMDDMAIDLLRKYGARYDYTTPRHHHLLTFATKIQLFYVFRNRSQKLHTMDQRFWNKREEILKDILASKAIQLINHRSMTQSRKWSQTALHYIAKTDQYKLAKMLMDAGANPYIRTLDDTEVDSIPSLSSSNASVTPTYTSIEIAKYSGQPKMAKFIESYAKELEANRALKNVAFMEDEANISPSQRLPFDLTMKIATTTAKMSPTQSRKYAYATYQKTMAQTKQKTPSKSKS
jgi:ankyrin repeat protein